MGASANECVLSRLKQYLANGWLEKAKKSNPEFATAVQEMTAQNISFGTNPVFVIGQVKGNCTASGESKYESTTTKRTISIDFTTESSVFIAKSNSASIDACKKAVKLFPEIAEQGALRNLSECKTLAEKHGKDLARNSLWDLNFSMDEYRLNRFDFVPLSKEFEAELWPIFGQVMLNGKLKRFLMGYYYRQNGAMMTDLHIDVPLTGKQKLIVWGIVGAAALAIIILCMLLK